ncbi:hypothetical protein [Halomonas sp. TD01]|uniref:hypothetical protein n=1 Tax=Halomonas sp. TD01 TaxID=999141 RepID=UPI000214EF2C|nr:hypothetical protein [Halomonas sp. TD01]EGP20413.1 hypothetical protein GME_06844 [Halomonas sp. TD01]CAH1045345.1 hypothetical protein HPTD01_3823 [Halomonas sp. TD01]
MKINVEFDLTPDEFRQSLGLPDVEAFQQNLLENIQRQMESGVDGYDPMNLMRPFLQQPMMQQGVSQGLANFGTYQQMMLDMLRKAGTSGGSAEQDSDTSQDESQEAAKPKPAASGKSASSARSSKAKATASSRSRAKG